MVMTLGPVLLGLIAGIVWAIAWRRHRYATRVIEADLSVKRATLGRRNPEEYWDAVNAAEAYSQRTQDMIEIGIACAAGCVSVLVLSLAIG